MAEARLHGLWCCCISLFSGEDKPACKTPTSLRWSWWTGHTMAISRFPAEPSLPLSFWGTRCSRDALWNPPHHTPAKYLSAVVLSYMGLCFCDPSALKGKERGEGPTQRGDKILSQNKQTKCQQPRSLGKWLKKWLNSRNAGSISSTHTAASNHQ